MNAKVIGAALIVSLGANVWFLAMRGSSVNECKRNPYEVCRPEIPVGEVVPDFTAPTLAGPKMHFPSDKLTLVSFWALWCEPCLKKMPILEKLRDEFPVDKVRIITVNSDPQEKRKAVEKKVAEMKLKIPTLLDPENSVATAQYTDGMLPLVYLIGADRRLKWKQTGSGKRDLEQMRDAIRKALSTSAKSL